MPPTRRTYGYSSSPMITLSHGSRADRTAVPVSAISTVPTIICSPFRPRSIFSKVTSSEPRHPIEKSEARQSFTKVVRERIGLVGSLGIIRRVIEMSFGPRFRAYSVAMNSRRTILAMVWSMYGMSMVASGLRKRIDEELISFPHSRGQGPGAMETRNQT
ncbi:hypothetical protein TREMEDRAFT_59694 [Tremella mesenterica DSM 1558]|uniref:uncharacterized protein n=1 Tax=Tremella mesenterica (strain ATCC 24925 / CBS 8224 / DSM 1558 / NBRC 9311 / NRRL Y-6157 / RJB 2259-6 / UBC 559-6) TaxID=578456 RepID=UPI0003F49F9E|nr:uncharacterized protein TREMEDRAFT_59694 [Tremella mesenterica DSM 1558]EIW73521.1 hypothetical protein TREMEDRAFT_59694 [Tremella mesenterica DSM 1558]